MIQRHVWVSGKVQGVGFRAYVFHEAQKIADLRGFVRNLTDGRVEAVFIGEEKSVLELVAACRKGPGGRAEVTRLEVLEEKIDSELGFFQIVR